MPKHYRPPGKKKEGNAAKYITRTKAVNYLQISLATFRKLCILKGVFPREPKKKVEGNHKTYYHMKDIAFLAHDPLIEKFREIKVHRKKVKKAIAKKNKDLADRLLNRPPTYKLDRLILERYPTFVDALRDLDDCLTMVHLFAALPAVEGERVQVQRIHNCRRLSHEWQAYISRTHSLRKTFISVKGIYYQAEVQGQKITWLTPHALQQVLTDDVDFNVMLTFLEFYEFVKKAGVGKDSGSSRHKDHERKRDTSKDCYKESDRVGSIHERKKVRDERDRERHRDMENETRRTGEGKDRVSNSDRHRDSTRSKYSMSDGHKDRSRPGKRGRDADHRSHRSEEMKENSFKEEDEEEYQEKIEQQLAMQEEDDPDKIKEEARRRKKLLWRNTGSNNCRSSSWNLYLEATMKRSKSNG